MKFIGFFREMPYAGKEMGSESIFHAARTRGKYEVGGMVDYLTSGHPILDLMEVTSDLIEGKFQSPGGSSVMTDGEYAWRVDLVEYVRHYRIDLPKEFVQWVESNSYQVPGVARQHLIDISVSVNEILGFGVDPGAAPR